MLLPLFCIIYHSHRFILIATLYMPKLRSLPLCVCLFLLPASTLWGCSLGETTTEKAKSEFSLKGMKKLQLGDFQGAITDYTKAIAKDPKDAEAYVNRGIAQAELGKNQDAIADYSQAIQLQADASTAYYNRANAYHQLKQYQEAIKDYSTAIKLTPDYGYAYANRAASYFKSGSKADAVADLKKAIEIFSQKSDAKNSDRLKQQLQKWQRASVESP
jgi:tetratricopeptide (TPR) repeat protein